MRKPSWILATTIIATAFLGSPKAVAQAQSQPQRCDQRTKILGHLAHSTRGRTHTKRLLGLVSELNIRFALAFLKLKAL